ncbi:hypothetical protein KMW28_23220 [Flammeovirga yaeyamensis]|uniref:Uncharacterized protein n=1 Tax=Flammeovirga yaeyamensis TaxID=367791 RepID=A0AAX1NCZ0_9BACT|nr:hypothetical protein [Flammeovirga yaeyamensis]MBB3696720.1 hypothetical protein [Flammeovirga yaeyamensis]NMF33390.1 hypothetical protein [Flammeovirga yaeyamensis]QWG05335.1 hypothetical protein KMW28_23220 [Flammeovirga yaeyamensis]
MSKTITISISDEYLDQIKSTGVDPSKFVRELTINKLNELREVKIEYVIAKEAAAIKAFDQKFSKDFDKVSNIIEKES